MRIVMPLNLDLASIALSGGGVTRALPLADASRTLPMRPENNGYQPRSAAFDAGSGGTGRRNAAFGWT
jgi:hypothetical protein